MNYTINKFFTLLMTLFAILSSLLLFLASYLRTESTQLQLSQKNRYETRLVADVLRQSSDDLTKFARLYTVTGNKKYKKHYTEVLYIRNGELKLPRNYENIYWDLLEPQRSQRHPLGKKRALINSMKGLSFDDYEFNKLQEAKNNSDELINLEIEAFSAMAGLYKDKNNNYTLYKKPNQKLAIELLHSQDYLKAKEKIMLPIDEFLIHLDKRTTKEVKTYKENISLTKNIISTISVILFILLISSFFIIKKKIIYPLLYLTHTITNFRLKKDIEKKIFYDDEIGFMIDEFFKMKNKINEDMQLIEQSNRRMQEYLKLVDKNIITSSTDLSGKITYVSEAFSSISGYSKKELLGHTHGIVKHPDMPTEFYETLWKTISANKQFKGDIKNRAKDGTAYWVDAIIYPDFDETGEKVGYTAIRVDITAKKQVEELLENSKLNELKIKQYVDLVDKNIITSSTDISGKITYVSEAFASISGFTKDELIGKNHRVVKHEDNKKEIYDTMWETLSNNRVWHGVIKNRKKNGGFYWVDATIYPTFNHHGEKTGYTAIRIDITDKKKIEDLLITDALTDIYNRRHFNDMLPKAINKAKRDRKYFSFIILDIDYFKQYNDTYGHQKGDEVLIRVATSIKKCTNRASDMCFRLGGEEFGILFDSLSPTEAYTFAETIRKNIENLKIEHSNSSVSSYVTVSLGLVTQKTTATLDSDSIYKEVDALLYKAKESGRNKVETHS